MINSFPSLFIMLIITTLLNFMRYKDLDDGIVARDIESPG
jgi:hypothetical protein